MLPTMTLASPMDELRKQPPENSCAVLALWHTSELVNEMYPEKYYPEMIAICNSADHDFYRAAKESIEEKHGKSPLKCKP
jgi:hypothetical protein